MFIKLDWDVKQTNSDKFVVFEPVLITWSGVEKNYDVDRSMGRQ